MTPRDRLGHSTPRDRLDRAIEEFIDAEIKARLTQVFADVQGKPVRQKTMKVTAPRQAKARKILPCSHTGCSKPSKGPRYGYLCEVHRKNFKPKAKQGK